MTTSASKMQGDQPQKGLMVMAGAVVAVMALGFYLIYSYANAERQDRLNDWYDRMDLIAESRSAALSAWLNRHLSSVEEIAGNATLGLYAGEIAAFGESEQRGYTFNYLRSAATRHGFHEASPLDQVAANVNRPRRAGLGVFKVDGTPMLQTAGMPFVDPESFAGVMNARPQPFMTMRVQDKMPVLFIGTPIKVIDGMDGGTEPLWLVGARVLTDDFYQHLKQPGDPSTSAENYLVQRGNGDGQVRPLSPLVHGGRIGDNTVDAAAAFAAARPGARGQMANYANMDVLVTGRELTAPVPWVLVRTVTAKEALSALNEERNSLILNLSLAGFVVLIMMVLVWRHGVSSRLQSAYREQQKLTEKNENLSQFLQTVSDSQPSAIVAVNNKKTITFANEKLGELVHLPAGELKGRRLETAFTADNAKAISPVLAKALAGTADSQIISLKPDSDDEAAMTMQMDVLPLDKSGDQGSVQALLVLQDITTLVSAQERAENNLKQLVSALTHIIDARDPWSQHHSSRVAEVAPTIAHEMGLAEVTEETVRTAGQLMNLGKIFVPSEILTKQSGLTDDELAMVRDSMDKGASLLTGLEFGGPVEQALRQVRENVDGSGSPQGLSASDIIIEAQILSVANAFVGMVSSRAHREGFKFEKALDILQEETGKKFERRVVAALQNIIENKGGKDKWSHYGDRIENL